MIGNAFNRPEAEAVTGSRPVGWHTRSPGSVNTRRLLVEEGGFLYESDAYNDDLPYFVRVGDKRHLVLPYAFDTNDMQFFHTNRFSGAADFAAYVIDAFDWLHREGAHVPKDDVDRPSPADDRATRPHRRPRQDPPAYCQPGRRLDRAAGRHRQPLACAIP
jgi:hypothetical protein